MLGKLIKYEFKSLFKTFSIAYVLLLITGIFLGATTKEMDSFIGGLAVFAFVAAIITTFVMLLVFTITRFNKALLSDEGYLMFTIPAKTSTIVLSKVLTMMFYNIITFIVVTIVGLTIGFMSSADFYNGFTQGLNEISRYMTFSFTVNSIIYLLLSTFIGTVLIYLALSFGQIGKLKKHKNIMAIVFYFVVTFIYSTISDIVLGKGILGDMKNITETTNPSIVIKEITRMLTFSNIYEIIFACIFFFATVYILDNKLNLD